MKVMGDEALSYEKEEEKEKQPTAYAPDR